MDNFWEKSKLVVDEPQQQPTAQPPAPSVGEFWKQSPAVKRGTDPKKLEEEHKKALAALDEQYQAKDFVRDALPGQVVLNQVAIDLASPVQRIVGNSQRADELNRAGNLVEQALQEQEKGGIVPDILQRGSRGALRSLGSMTAGGAAGRAMGVGAAVGAIGTAAAQQANQAYTEGKDAGLKGNRLAEYVLGNAIIEAAPAAIMQGMGMGGAEATVGRMLGDGAKTAAKPTMRELGRSILKGSAQELPEELVTTAGQEATSQAYGVNPQALAPANLGKSLIETAVQTVLTMGFAESMNAAKQKVADWMMRGVKPEQIVETLQQMAPQEQQQAPEQPKPPIDVAQSEQQRVGALQERFRNRALDTKEQDIWNDPRYPLMLSLGEPEVAQKLAEKPTYLPADFEEAGLPPVNNPQLRRQWKERVKEAVAIPPEARRAMLEDTSNEMRITKDWTKVPEGVEPPQSPMIETIQSSFGTVIRLKPRQQSTPSGDTVSPQAPPPVTPTTQPEPTSYGQEETKGREGRQGLLTQPVPTAPTAEPSLEQPKPTEQQVRPSAEASSYDDTFNPYTEEHPEYQGWYTVPDGVTKQVLSTQYGDVQVDFYNPQTNQAEVTDEKGDSWVMDMGEEGDGQAVASDTQSQPEQPTPEQPVQEPPQEQPAQDGPSLADIRKSFKSELNALWDEEEAVKKRLGAAKARAKGSAKKAQFDEEYIQEKARLEKQRAEVTARFQQAIADHPERKAEVEATKAKATQYREDQAKADAAQAESDNELLRTKVNERGGPEAVIKDLEARIRMLDGRIARTKENNRWKLEPNRRELIRQIELVRQAFPEQPQGGLQNAPESTQTAQATSDTTSAQTQPESQPEAPVAKKRLGTKYPEPKNRDETLAVPAYSVYLTTVGGQKKYAVRGSQPDTFTGDTLWDTAAEAEKEAKRSKAIDEDRQKATQEAEARQAAEAQKEADYVASFQGFDSGSPLTFGKSRKALDAKVRYKGKEITRKQLIEQKVAEGSLVDGDGLKNADGAYLDAGALTKTGLRYAQHLIDLKQKATEPTPAPEEAPQTPQPQVEQQPTEQAAPVVEPPRKTLGKKTPREALADQMKGQAAGGESEAPKKRLGKKQTEAKPEAGIPASAPEATESPSPAETPAPKKRLGKKQPPSDQQPPDRKASSGGTKKLGKAPQGPLPQPTKSAPINRNPPSEMTDAIKKDIQSKKNQVGKRSIAEYLNKAFHAAMIVTKSQTTRRNPALFRNFGATIFTRNGSWSINIHEAAHALSAMLSDKVPQWYAQNEMALAQFAASAEAPHASDDSGEEGLAEVIRLYVSNRPVDQALIDSLRQMVEAVAPEAWNALEDAREAYRLHTGRSYLDQEQADRNDIAAAKGKSLIEKSMDAFWTNMNTIVGNSTLIHRYKRHEYAKIAGESAIAMVEPTGFLGWAKGLTDREHKIRQHMAEQIQAELKKSPADIDTAYRSKLRSAAVVKQALEGDGLTVYVQGSGLADLSQAEYDALDAAGFPMPKSFAKNFEMQRLTEKSYEQIMKPLKDEKERNDFQTALYDRVAHERHVKYGMPYKGMTDGLKADELKARSDKAFAENPHWEQVSDELQGYMAQTLLLGLIAGHLTVDDVVRIYQKYEDYAPLQRQMEGGKKRLGKILEQTTPNFGLYGAKGSELEYLSLDEAVYNRVNGMVRAYHENMLLKSLRDRVQEISKRKDIPYEARKDIERTLIPLRVDLKMAANIDSGEQRQIFANAINRQMLADMGTDPAGMSDKQVREAAETAGIYVKPDSISVDLPGRPVMRATTPNMNQVVGLWEGGNTKFYLIQDPLSYQMVQNLGAKVPEFVQWYSNIVKDFVNPWKRAITQSFRFLYRNILRDPITAAWFADNKIEAIPFYYTAQTVIGHVLGTDLYKEASQATKTMTLMLDATTTNGHQTQLAKFKEAMWDGLYVDDWQERGPIGKAFGVLSIAQAGLLKSIDFVNYVTGMRYLSEQSESITRKGRYIAARRRGMLPAQAHSEFDQASGEFSQRQANASLSAIIRVAGFMNPALQIIWQTAAAATPASPNQRFNLNTTKVAYLALLGAGWAASNLLSMRYNMDDDEWEEATEKLRQRSEEDRMSNLAVHGWLKVPYDNGLAGAVVAFAANMTEDLLLGSETDFEDRSLEVLKKVTSAPGIDNIIPPQPKSILEATALNYSFFTKKPVVPPELIKLYPNQEFMQSYSDTPEFYVEIAKKLEGTSLDMSPLQIKHMVGGVGTAVWDNAITWIDKLNKGTATYKDFPLIKGMFVNNPDGFQSRSVRELMDMDRRYDEVDAYLRQARDLTPEQRQEAEQVRERLQLAHATMKRVSEVYRKVEKERDKPEPDQKKIDDLEGQMARIASEFINDKKIDLEALSEPYQSAKAKLIPYKADNSSTWKMGKGEPEKPRRPLKTKAADPKAWEKYEKEVESYPDRMKQWEEEQKEAVEFVRQYEDVFKQRNGGKLPDKSKEAIKAIRDLATGAGAPAEPKRRLGETAAEWNRRRESHTENRKRFIEARQEALRLLKSSE